MPGIPDPFKTKRKHAFAPYCLINLSDLPAQPEWAGTKENLNHKDHEAFEEQLYHFFSKSL
jgi:hypothetical protein